MKKQLTGFTLVELMVAMVLGLLVLGGALTVFLANQTTGRANQALAEIQNTARMAHLLMAHDIRNAGFTGCGNSPRVANVVSIDNATNPIWANWRDGQGIRGLPAPVGAINGRNANVGSEALRVLYGGGRSNTIRLYDGQTLTLNSPSVVGAGELAIACDENLASIFQVSQVGGVAQDEVQHRVDGLNCDANLGFVAPEDWACGVHPARNFNNGAMLMRLESVAWFVAPSLDDANISSLFRASLINGDQLNEEVLFGVNNLQFAYLNGDTMAFQTAAAVTAANAWGRVIAVNVTLTLDPAILQGTEVPANARTIRFLVSLRNRLG